MLTVTLSSNFLVTLVITILYGSTSLNFMCSKTLGLAIIAMSNGLDKHLIFSFSSNLLDCAASSSFGTNKFAHSHVSRIYSCS